MSAYDEKQKEEWQFISSEKAFEQFIAEVEARMQGKIKPISTGWLSFDEAGMGGLERSWVITIGGKSGAGKTAFLAQLLRQIREANDFPVVDLNFTFEMKAKRLVSRQVSREMNMTLRQLYSASNMGNIRQEDLDELRSLRHKFKNNSKHASVFVEVPKTVEDMRRYAMKARETFVKNGYPHEAIMVVSLDHLLLAKKFKIGDNLSLLEEIMAMENEYKKEDENTIFINLSQLNRESDTSQRIEKPTLHYPNRGDLYGGDFMFHYSDMIGILNNPYRTGLKFYGPNKYPVQSISGHDLVYMHIIKNRDGEPGLILPFEFVGQYFHFLEYPQYINETYSNTED